MNGSSPLTIRGVKALFTRPRNRSCREPLWLAIIGMNQS